MTKTFAMFPGQGSQYVGMGGKLLEDFPAANQVFEEASDAASMDIKKLCLEGPESDLTLTHNTQPAILTVSVAYWRVLRSETPLDPLGYAGHSLGEYSALVAAGRLGFFRAVELVRARGKAMQEAVPAGLGSMAAVMNAVPEELVALCESNSDSDESAQVVNFNSPQQLVIAGHKAAVDRVCASLSESGNRFVPLQVSAPFHSQLMGPAREKMTPLLEQTEFQQNESRIYPNLSGEVTTEYGADYLVQQIDQPVRWLQTMQASEALGCDTYLEVGPGKVLFGLGRRCIAKGPKFLVCENFSQVLEALSQM